MAAPLKCNARPEPVSFDPQRTAVIVIDMQNDFGARSGMFDRAGIEIGPIEKIVQPIAALLEDARAAGATIIYTRMEFKPDLSDAGGPSSPHWIKHLRMGLGEPVQSPDGGTSRILVRDTWNTDIVADLAPKSGDLVVTKHRYSAFFETSLDSVLRARETDTLVFVGATTSICVESTLRDAMFRDYVCIILEDCTAEPIAHDAARSNHEATLLNVELLFGWVTDSKQLRSAFQAKDKG